MKGLLTRRSFGSSTSAESSPWQIPVPIPTSTHAPPSLAQLEAFKIVLMPRVSCRSQFFITCT